MKRVSLPGGLELPYVEQGDESGAPAILLHAYADSWRSFELVLAHLPSSVHAFAPTQRGHGDAGRPVSGYRVEDFAGDLGAFMDAVGLERAVLVASSSAAFTVQRYAIDCPHRVLGMVLVGVPWSLHEYAESPLAEAVSRLGDPVDPTFVREFVESTVVAPLRPGFLEALVEERLKVPARVWQATLQGLLEVMPPLEGRTIDVPTLILWGDGDDFVSRDDQEKLAAAIPGSNLTVYEGAGHVVHWDEPRRVAADIAAFVRRFAPRSV